MYEINITNAQKTIIKQAIELAELSIQGEWRDVLNDFRMHNPEYHNALTFIEEISEDCLQEISPHITDEQNFLKRLNILKKEIDIDKKLSRESILLIDNLLNNFSRFGMAQFDYWLEFLSNHAKTEPKNALFFRDLDSYNKVMDFMDLKENSHSFYGINSVNNIYKVAFDMHQVFRRYLAFERNPSGGIGVNFRPVLKTGNLPLVSIINSGTKFKIPNSFS